MATDGSSRRGRGTSGTPPPSAFGTAFTLALFVSAALVRPVAAAPHVPIAGDVALDAQVAHVLERLVAGDVERATVLARSLARRHPRFALGQLLHAELAATAALDGTLVGAEDGWPPALVDLLLEARARLEAPPPANAALAPPVPPAPFVQIGRGVEHLVVVDLERSTLALHAVRGGVATPVREHYVSSGSAGFGKRREGDRKTPLGLYRITAFRDDGALPELYGAGALELDYPNAHDRRLGRTGSGIWLHGVPRERRSRAPRSSEGCVTMSNEHLLALRERLDPARTLVVLAGPGDTTARDEHAARDLADARGRYRTLFRAWRDARPADDPAAAALAGVDENDVTILETTVDGLPGSPELLVMDVRPPGDAAAGVTLWWSRPPGAENWELTLEEGGSGST